MDSLNDAIEVLLLDEKDNIDGFYEDLKKELEKYKDKDKDKDK